MHFFVSCVNIQEESVCTMILCNQKGKEREKKRQGGLACELYRLVAQVKSHISHIVPPMNDIQRKGQEKAQRHEAYQTFTSLHESILCSSKSSETRVSDFITAAALQGKKRIRSLNNERTCHHHPGLIRGLYSENALRNNALLFALFCSL